MLPFDSMEDDNERQPIGAGTRQQQFSLPRNELSVLSATQERLVSQREGLQRDRSRLARQLTVSQLLRRLHDLRRAISQRMLRCQSRSLSQHR